MVYELIITSPYAYVNSRVDSNTFTMGNPMPESTLTICQSRLYPPVRDSGFLAVVRFGSFPLPTPRQQDVTLSLSSCVSPVQLTNGRGWGGEGAKSYDGEKAWSSTIPYIFFFTCLFCINRTICNITGNFVSTSQTYI